MRDLRTSDDIPIGDNAVTVIRARDRKFACTRKEKARMMQSHCKGDAYFAVWGGKWESHAFLLSDSQIAQMVTCDI